MELISQHSFGRPLGKIVLEREIMKFTLKLYSNELITRNVVQDVIEIFSEFISETYIPF